MLHRCPCTRNRGLSHHLRGPRPAPIPRRRTPRSARLPPDRFMSRHLRTPAADGDGYAAAEAPVADGDRLDGPSRTRPASPARPVRPGRAPHPGSASDDVLLTGPTPGCVGYAAAMGPTTSPTAPHRSRLLPTAAGPRVTVTRTAVGAVNVVVLASLARVPVSGELHSTRERGKALAADVPAQWHAAVRTVRVTHVAPGKSASLR
jgi:hypothetical protein